MIRHPMKINNLIREMQRQPHHYKETGTVEGKFKRVPEPEDFY